jgi:hypothetical protein
MFALPCVGSPPIQDDVQADLLLKPTSLFQAPWMAALLRARLLLASTESSTLGTMKGSVGRLFSHTKELSRVEGLIQKWPSEGGALFVLVDTTG